MAPWLPGHLGREISKISTSVIGIIDSSRRGHQLFDLIHFTPQQDSCGSILITYSATISACEKGQTPQQALHLIQELQLRDLLPNVIPYNAAISACEKGRKPQQALILLRELKLRSLLPNVITYSAAISACESICCRAWSLEAICPTRCDRFARPPYLVSFPKTSVSDCSLSS